MSLKSLLDIILSNEHLTRGLDDPEARMLVEWLVARTELLHAAEPDEQTVHGEIERQCRHARAIARFVTLWCIERSFGAALQLAATERFLWPLPTEPMLAADLMDEILTWERAAR